MKDSKPAITQHRKDTDMSIWTHVTGVIRIETSKTLTDTDIENLLGKRLPYKASQSLKDEYKNNPENFMPARLNFCIHDHQVKYELNSCIVSVFGDIDDYVHEENILAWFRERLKKSKLAIRQACITITGLYNITWSM